MNKTTAAYILWLIASFVLIYFLSILGFIIAVVVNVLIFNGMRRKNTRPVTLPNDIVIGTSVEETTMVDNNPVPTVLELKVCPDCRTLYPSDCDICPKDYYSLRVQQVSQSLFDQFLKYQTLQQKK